MKVRHRALLGLIGGVGAAMLLVSWASADGIPETNTLYYSGVLEEGGAVVDGTRNVVIRLFDDATTGTQRCVTNASGVGFDAGRFRVPLVEACVDAVRDEPDLWVEVQVGGDAPFARTKLGAVPYAVEAERAQEAMSAETAVSSERAQNAQDVVGGGALDRRLLEVERAGGASGSRWHGEYCGSTAPTNGNFGGYAIGKERCEAACGSPTARMCRVSELIADAEQRGVVVPFAWSWVVSEGVGVSSGGARNSSCLGFGSSAASEFGTAWNGNTMLVQSCDSSRPILCCD